MYKRILVVLTLVSIFFCYDFANAERKTWNGHEYEYFTEQVSWHEAKSRAELKGGYLATINSSEENEWIANTFPLTSANSHLSWIGGYQDKNDPGYSEPSGGWKWVTDEPMNYLNWHKPYQPDNWNGPGGSEDYLTIMPNGEWNDYAEWAPYLVEWGEPMQIPPDSDPPANLPPAPESSIRDQLDYLIPKDLVNPNKPTIVITHGLDSNTRGWVKEMGEAITDRVFGLFNIVAWEWAEEANTYWWLVLRRASAQAPLLAERLQSEGLTKWLHMIGHSAGAKLISETAR